MDYETCPNLPAMFFDRAARHGDRPFLWAKRDGAYRPLSWREAARAGAARWRAACARSASRRGDRVGAGLREPAGMDHRRSRHHGGRRDHRAGLYHQHGRRPSPRPRQQRRARGDRLDRRRWPSASCPRPTRSRPSPAIIAIEPLTGGQLSHAEFYSWDDIAGARRRRWPTMSSSRVAAIAPRRRRLPHLHLRHRRRAQGRDADPRATSSPIAAAPISLLETLGLGDEVFLSFLPLSHSYEHTAGHDVPDLARRRRSISPRAPRRSPPTCSRRGRRS